MSRRAPWLAPILPASQEKITVLLVDDDDGVRSTISRQLIRPGSQIISVADGYEALERVEKSLSKRHSESHAPINLVLPDLTMPQTDGTETFEKLDLIAPDRKRRAQQRLLGRGTAHPLRGKAIVGYLCKPFEIQALGLAVRDLTRRSGERYGPLFVAKLTRSVGR